MSGERVVLHCPIQPGAFLQQYSVRWMKGGIPIANVNNAQNVMTADDSHYQIDRGRYSLIISSVNVNDTSTDYQCDLSVLNPVTSVLQVLQPSTPVTLSLKVIGMLIVRPRVSSEKIESLRSTFFDLPHYLTIKIKCTISAGSA